MALTWQEYIPLAMRTNSNTVGAQGRASIDFMHGAAGLATEVHEWVCAEDELHKEEEAGDCCWFIALCLHAIGVDSPISKVGIMDPQDASIWILDIAKKWFAYGKLPNSADVDFLLQYAIPSIITELEIGSSHMESNIRKLKARYPYGFNQGGALNRDKDAEYFAIKAFTD